MDWILSVVPILHLQAARSIDKAVIDEIHSLPRQYDPEVLGKHLTQVIEANEFPPPSLRAVCKRLDLHQTVATRMFPELTRQIMAEFKTFQTIRKRVRETFMKRAVESSVNQLLLEGRSLSFHQLAKVLPQHFSIRDGRVLEEFRRLRKEAEDEMQAAMQEPAVSPV